MRIKAKIRSNVLITSVVTASVLLSACGGGGDGISITDNIDQNQPIECVNGIPKNLKTKGDGILSQELFGLESSLQNSKPILFFTSNTLNHGVWYEKISQLIPNNVPSSFSEFDSGYQISPKLLITQFKQQVGSTGFPAGYVLSQNQEAFQFVPFSDNCNMQSERQIAMHLKTIDLSGKKISYLFAYYEQNSNQNERLIHSDLYQDIASNQALSQKLLSSNVTFPANSKIYYVDKMIYTQPIIDFYDEKLSSSSNLDAYISDNQLPSGYSWKKDQFAGQNVVYPVDTKAGKYAYLQNKGIYPAIQYNGKVYDGEGVIPGDFMEYSKNNPTDDFEMDTTYFNKIAAQAFTDALR